ncbi:OsmC family peroxiredoxin [Microbulbifer sp. SH-1]|uniref:OsmC family protein n=1 Tax=Microbulbifer sp. SH-1 TaxID=2681547 RepID=UPI001408E2EA|nr:OsmC family protein [Microbulbifer sp. SH-1]QIL89282.1 OsmC family peroxiredoxin [Microbulbifer sp. SH-1]
MDTLPHHYQVAASAAAEGNITLTAEGLAPLASAAPSQFDGPGDQWSPEELLVAAVADCFILTFRAIAKYNNLDWTNLECSATGTLDKDGRKTCFTAFEVNATLRVPQGTDTDKAHKLLEKSEENCLITNSLSAPVTLNAEVTTS